MMGSPRVHGIDFTSAPGPRKPIVCATCELRGPRLRLVGLERWSVLADFEAFLSRPGPWLAGLDFPFGLPAAFVSALAAPADWQGYVEHFAALGRQGFRTAVSDFKAGQPVGHKDLKRAADRLASAASPLNVTRPPVGLMFIEGAGRLCRSGVSVWPCRPRAAAGTQVVEVYPALAVRALVGRRPYKGGRGIRAAGQTDVRRALLGALAGNAALRHYGLRLALPAATLIDELVGDREGDGLDAVICALQAAWGYRSTGGRLGMPCAMRASEGWIVDPALPLPARR
ncbi:MAG TPA: DUF429 domain-containing protein [Gammaproteobacteria bacterium]|nr:DUF429 domain-containing protein [Gammaproteobacteria bacterium]